MGNLPSGSKYPPEKNWTWLFRCDTCTHRQSSKGYSHSLWNATGVKVHTMVNKLSLRGPWRGVDSGHRAAAGPWDQQRQEWLPMLVEAPEGSLWPPGLPANRCGFTAVSLAETAPSKGMAEVQSRLSDPHGLLLFPFCVLFLFWLVNRWCYGFMVLWFPCCVISAKTNSSRFSLKFSTKV